MQTHTYKRMHTQTSKSEIRQTIQVLQYMFLKVQCIILQGLSFIFGDQNRAVEMTATAFLSDGPLRHILGEATQTTGSELIEDHTGWEIEQFEDIIGSSKNSAVHLSNGINCSGCLVPKSSKLLITICALWFSWICYESSTQQILKTTRDLHCLLRQASSLCSRPHDDPKKSAVHSRRDTKKSRSA